MSRYRHELGRLYDFAEQLNGVCEVRREGEVHCLQQQLPVFSFCFGPYNPDAPALVLVGGVHGLEVIGMQVVYAFMETLGQLLRWDLTIKKQLESLQIYMYPCANPGGVLLGRRSNPNGVDLMRNAPIEAAGVSPLFIGAGHKLSNRLPWFRGNPQCMEAEAELLVGFCRRELYHRPFSLVLDIHSGFGVRDRLWFPFAHTRTPFPLLSEVVALKELMDHTLPNHFYSLEPQCIHYLAHGDIWDYIYLDHSRDENSRKGALLPLCLELGAWRWMRKNPKQIFSPIGLFHPVMEHRKKRVLRHHYPLFDFLLRSVASWRFWFEMTKHDRDRRILRGLNDWYSHAKYPQDHRAAASELPTQPMASPDQERSNSSEHLRLIPSDRQARRR